MDVVISDHARFEIVRRQLSEEMVRSVAQNPPQVVKLNKIRKICQNRYYDPAEGKEMLLRVICQERHSMLLVITAYRSAKIDNYRAKEDQYESDLRLRYRYLKSFIPG